MSFNVDERNIEVWYHLADMMKMYPGATLSFTWTSNLDDFFYNLDFSEYEIQFLLWPRSFSNEKYDVENANFEK